MKSTGNDIIALNAIDIQRTNTPAFYSKIINAAEQALYRGPGVSTLPFPVFIWLLWSIKESVYKYLKRTDAKLVFSPTKIIIQNIVVPGNAPVTGLTNSVWENGQSEEGFFTGGVKFKEYQLYFRSKIDEAFIASVVNPAPGFDNIYWGVKKIDNPCQENQSKQAREFVLQKLKLLLSADDLRIEKTPAGCPIVLKGGEQLTIPVSLSHHDHFVAYSFLLEAV